MNIFWFRRDLRLGDNRALSDLVKYNPCSAIYIHDVALQLQDDFSGIHRDFINESLKDLSKRFLESGGFLNVYEGNSIEIFNELINKYNVKLVYTSSEIGTNPIRNRDKRLNEIFKKHRVKWLVYQNNGVVDGLRNRDGWSGKWNKEMYRPVLEDANVSSTKILTIDNPINNLSNSKIYKVNYQKKYNGGELSGHNQLNHFLSESGRSYSIDISSPLKSEKSCSRLSPYITFGNLSMTNHTSDKKSPS